MSSSIVWDIMLWRVKEYAKQETNMEVTCSSESLADFQWTSLALYPRRQNSCSKQLWWLHIYLTKTEIVLQVFIIQYQIPSQSILCFLSWNMPTKHTNMISSYTISLWRFLGYGIPGLEPISLSLTFFHAHCLFNYSYLHHSIHTPIYDPEPKAVIISHNLQI